MERLVAGRERIYVDRFWNEFSATPARFSEGAREHYSKPYAMPGAMHSGFMQFAAFDQDAIDNQQFLAKGKLSMPCWRLGARSHWRDDGKDHAVCSKRAELARVGILVFHHGSESKYGSVWNCRRTAGVDGIGDVSPRMNNILKHRLQHPIRRNLGLVRDLHHGLSESDCLFR